MELFSELYNCYYQIVDQILTEAEDHPVDAREMKQICDSLGFSESGLYLLPKLMDGEWRLLTREGSKYRALTSAHGTLPLTRLQRSWIKTLLLDDRFRLFFTDEELSILDAYTDDAELLWRNGDFHYYDRYADGDCYASPAYRQHFQTLVQAITDRRYVNISYHSEKGNRITHHYLPLKLEYSEKNDRFRLMAVLERNVRSPMIHTLNLHGITEVTPLDRCCMEEHDFAAIIRKSYYHEPVRLLIKNRRNALERAMLHFSNYEKRTRKIDEDTWECLIYYNRSMETELLIEILSFGPAIQVTGPDSFLGQVKERLRRQAELFSRRDMDRRSTVSPS